MDDVANRVVPSVDEYEVTADHLVVVVSRCRRELPGEIARNRMSFPLQFTIERTVNLKARLFVSAESILGSQPPRCMILMVVVPLFRHLPVVVVEAGMLLPILSKC